MNRGLLHIRWWGDKRQLLCVGWRLRAESQTKKRALEMRGCSDSWCWTLEGRTDTGRGEVAAKVWRCHNELIAVRAKHHDVRCWKVASLGGASQDTGGWNVTGIRNIDGFNGFYSSRWNTCFWPFVKLNMLHPLMATQQRYKWNLVASKGWPPLRQS